ncbi:MAG: response regulator [Campylobacterota bacterium]|nr:response regulator [Campylobacterota bacterium]
MENNNILIIDSDTVFNEGLSTRFKKLGYSVLQSYELDKAKESIKNKIVDFDLIIFNLNINSSMSFVRFIQKNSKAKIIVISDIDDCVKRDDYFRSGIVDFFIKQDKLEYIIDDIDTLLIRIEDNKSESILIIDDSKVVCFQLKNLLSNKNYNVFTASTAKDGLDIIKKDKLSLIILDMELPDMHGLEVMQELRDIYMINNCPILIISGSTNPAIISKSLKHGASDFLNKSFSYEEFLLKVDLLIKSAKWERTFKVQKKQIEENLQSFEALVNSTIEALFIFENNICIDINDVAIDLFKYNSKDDVLYKDISEIFINISDENITTIQDNNVNHSFEESLTKSDYTKFDAQIKERNIQLTHKVLKIIAIIDITDLKQKELLLNNQSKMASMGEMIGNIAHQWRQPLTAISVAAGGIKLGYELDINDEDEVLKELDNIVDNTKFLSDTIEDFQNFLKNDRQMSTFSLNEIIDKSISIVSANLGASEINIIKEYEGNIKVTGIPNDLVQVLLNIINNAGDILKTQKYIEKKKYIIIHTHIENSNVILTLQDTAGGVPQNIINKIFEPYFTTKHQSKGTGLGLYMTHKLIVEGMSGDIKVINTDFIYEDISYTGAKFIITLPIN